MGGVFNSAGCQLVRDLGSGGHALLRAPFPSPCSLEHICEIPSELLPWQVAEGVELGRFITEKGAEEEEQGRERPHRVQGLLPRRSG